VGRHLAYLASKALDKKIDKVSYRKVRTLSRKVKLYRDHLIDNALIIDDSQEDFLQIINLIFNNAGDEKKPLSAESTPEDENQSSDNTSSETNSNNNDRDQEDSQDNVEGLSASSVSLPKEYRKLYREIVKKVHPDRHSMLGIESDYQVKRAKKIFQNAKICAESKNEQGIVELCAQLEVDMSSLNHDSVESYLDDSQSQLTQRIHKQEKSLQMMWHYNENNLDAKVKIVMAYIAQTGKRGKNITETLVKDVVTSYNKDGTRKKRKVGQRPAKLKR
tara:strand:- start:2815 stop:3642 length:828 start_codon:yes stop_codon:yes gene_type:complete